MDEAGMKDTIHSHWRDLDGRPAIVQAGPVA
jgi:hypothetical protein